MEEGRNEEAKKMRLRNSMLIKMNHTKDLVKIVLLRVIEKLYVLRIQEPSVFVGVEQDVEWIQKKMMDARVKYSYSPEELTDVAYDFEDVIDDLILRSASKKNRGRNWERCLLLIRIHKKLELINSKIHSLPRFSISLRQSAFPINGSIEEIDWSDIFLVCSHSQSVANTVVSLVEEKVSALLSQGAIQPYTKKAAMRVLDKLRSLNGFIKSLESVELDDSGMVWMEELSHVALFAVIAMDDFIHRNS